MHFRLSYLRSTYWLLVISVLLPTACVDEPQKDREGQRYIDIAQFVDAQVALLDSLNPPVRKQVIMENAVEEKLIRNVDWSKELAIFREADISRPALANVYEVRDEPGQVRVYTPRTDENPAVTYLKVAFDPQNRNIVSLEAVISRSNYLFESEWRVQMRNQALEGGGVKLQSYEVTGYQQLIFNDKVPFHVRAQVDGTAASMD